MTEISYRMTIDDNGASDAMLGLYANLVEEAFQLVVKEPNKSIPKQLLLLAALSGQVISTMLELGAIVEGEAEGDTQAKLDKLDELLPKLTALSLMLNYSIKGNDGQAE